MKQFFALVIFLCAYTSYGQCVFRSNPDGGSSIGTWSDSNDWFQDGAGCPGGAAIPNANYDVEIRSGHTIQLDDGTTRVCSSLTITEGIIDFTTVGVRQVLVVKGSVTISGSTGNRELRGLDGEDHLFTLQTFPTVANATAGSFTVSASSDLTVNDVRINSQDPLTLNGTLNFTNPVQTGSTLFQSITVGESGVFNNSTTQNFVIGGGITNNNNTLSTSFIGCGGANTCSWVINAAGAASIGGDGNIALGGLRLNNGSQVTFDGSASLNVNNGINSNGTGTNSFTNEGDLTVSSNSLLNTARVAFDFNTDPNSTVTYVGTLNENLLTTTASASNPAGVSYENLVINMDNSAVLAQVNGGNVQVDNNLTITEGRFRVQTANTLTVGGDISINGGEFEPNFSGNTISANAITMTAGTFDYNNGTLNLTTDFNLNGGTYSQIQAGAIDFNITGNFNINGGSADINSGSIDFVNMTVDNGATINIANPIITSNSGTITIENGTYTQDGAGGTYDFNNIVVNANGIWNVTAAYDPTIRGDMTNNGTFTGCNGLGCDYTLLDTDGHFFGTSLFDDMSDLIFNDGAIYENENTGGLDATDGLETTSGTGTFINNTNGLLYYGGANASFSVTNFTASATGNTVVYNRDASNQLIRATTDLQYHNLTIDKNAPSDMTTGAIFTINGTLNLLEGDIIMGGQNLIISRTGTIATGSDENAYIQQTAGGRLIKIFNDADAVGVSVTYPLGTSALTGYAPLDFNFDSFTGSGNVTFSITGTANGNRNDTNSDNIDPVLPTEGDDIGPNANTYLNVYWDVDIPVGITNFAFDAVGDFTFFGSTTDTPPDETMFPVIQREVNSIVDWHVVGATAAFGEGEVLGNKVNFRDIDNSIVGNPINERTSWILYAMDNELNGIKNRLPITLISFDAYREGKQVMLEWATADEENNDFFGIERSANGVDFQTIMTVPGAGNSNQALEYTAIDAFPFEGRNYYRLKQTDFNGQFSYSDIVSVTVEEVDHSLRLKKNLLKQGEYVEFIGLEQQPDNVRFQLVTQDGRLLEEGSIQELQSENLILRNRGLFLIKVTSGLTSKTFKVVVN